MARPVWSSGRSVGFNLTPIIDVVFLLIIFFMVVCQFITAESFDVAVPDRIDTARDAEQTQARHGAIVTVLCEPDGQVGFAVGARHLTAQGPELARSIAAALDRQLQSLPANERIVTLRCDKEVTFAHAKYALAGVGYSTATDVRWAVIRAARR